MTTEAGEVIGWSLRPAEPADVFAIAELRAVVLRADLERLGRFDEHRVRQRFRDSFSPAHTSIITVGPAFAGCVAVRPADDGHWLEHFYVAPGFQGCGVGSGVLRTLLRKADEERVTVRLNVLRGSPAQRLYERHGFTLDAADEIDIFMTRRPPP
ncbi:GNAT family N-acetyltransferase [Asanoa siamensis]|uniref:N-acetyltransferase n=1 Tax=Asanoa siamensis TaxID=926357 RepID=A0ABQ4CZA7_9ACTN|nr:GNAT family N-acetyltransferase [Asanoa siamensis]GIF76616.1 N-acetyltransferase [Asanoa siamensis]